MPNLHFRKEEQSTPKASIVFDGASVETVRVSQKSQRNERLTYSLATTVLPFFVIIAAAIGSVFFMHDRHMREQKELYKQYLAMNAWQATFKREYDKLKPYMLEFEAVSTAKGQDWNRIYADYSAFQAGVSRIASTPKPGRMEQKMDGDLQSLASEYRDRLHANHLPETLYKNKADLQEARETLAFTLVPHVYVLTDGHEGDLRVAQRRADALVAKMSDREVESGLRSTRLGMVMEHFRRDFENEFRNTYEIPEGLDLDRVRGLK
jgi:hypothetical protein